MVSFSVSILYLNIKKRKVDIVQLSSILFGAYFVVAPFMEIQEKLC